MWSFCVIQALEGKTDALHINADFWVHFMWKRIMGRHVLNATAHAAVGTKLDADVRVYAHCGTAPSPNAHAHANAHALPTDIRGNKFAGNGVEGNGQGKGAANPMGIILININATSPRTATLLGARKGSVYTYWTLTPDPDPQAGGVSGVFGKATLMNGMKLKDMLADGKPIGAIPVDGKTSTSGTILLPPFSVTFASSPDCAVPLP